MLLTQNSKKLHHKNISDFMVFNGIEFLTSFGKPESKFHVPTQVTQVTLTLGDLDLGWDMVFGLRLSKRSENNFTKIKYR